MSVGFDFPGPQASIASVTDRVRRIELGAPVAAAYFLGDTAAFVGAEEAVTLVGDDGASRKIEVSGGGILCSASDGKRLVMGGDDGKLVALDGKGETRTLATDAKRRYYSFRLATVVGGVIVPALVSISLAGAGRFDAQLDFVLRLLTFIVSAVVAVTASVEGFFHFGERWRHYRVNAELLKSEGWQYLTQSGGYRRMDEPNQAFQTFAARVEEILRDDVEGFMTQVARNAPVEKHDIFTKL